MKESTDIIIAGGGIAGYAAAMAAAQSKRVTLIDRNVALGGASTQSNVGTLCGLYYRSSPPNLITHSFCKKFTEDLFRMNPDTKLVSLPDDLHVVSYEWSALENLMKTNLDANGVRVLTNAEIRTVHATDSRVTAVGACQNDTETIIPCESIVDCTGIGHLANLLGQQMIREDKYQAAAQVIRLKNVKPTQEYSLDMSLKKIILKEKQRGMWPTLFTSISVIPGSLRNGCVDFKLQLSVSITDESDLVHRLKDEIKQSLPELLSLIVQIESLNHSTLEILFPLPGIRSQQRPRGKYVLTSEDVLNCRKPQDGIAVGTWPVELWDYKGNVKLEYFPAGASYTIPARCLMSDAYENLFFAGKGISADSRAIGSARVTGTCLQTGYAAGKIAACCTQEEIVRTIENIHRQIST